MKTIVAAIAIVSKRICSILRSKYLSLCCAYSGVSRNALRSDDYADWVFASMNTPMSTCCNLIKKLSFLVQNRVFAKYYSTTVIVGLLGLCVARQFCWNTKILRIITVGTEWLLEFVVIVVVL